MSTGLPSTRRKPVGAFIHALAMTTKMPESAPLRATIAPERHRDPDGRKNDVKSKRHRHLRTRRQKVIHKKAQMRQFQLSVLFSFLAQIHEVTTKDNDGNADDEKDNSKRVQ